MVINKYYILDRGNTVWLNFSPQQGHEQKGYRPAIVLSSKIYNQHGLMLSCPITSQIKGYPFEVLIKCNKIHGAILADNIKNLDWKARKIKYEDKATDEIVTKVYSLIAALLLQ